jgi:hypothetical protein
MCFRHEKTDVWDSGIFCYSHNCGSRTRQLIEQYRAGCDTAVVDSLEETVKYLNSTNVDLKVSNLTSFKIVFCCFLKKKKKKTKFFLLKVCFWI